ncbi:hypothetical protein KP806_24400 [Paenibacillus sp. N4]|uniref:hypothetical protein n=1 Tax=Paenibacillus vietnamensis TaxID=2590547 RepID=UPI001CD15685|nr:hypothetical protein [Paenibacillus vietnamensis]MCA0758201.1 hypothetical protein [Paenibacillus vietnamensis]
MTKQQRTIQTLDYLSAKLTGAGGVFVLFLLVAGGVDRVQWSELAQMRIWWIVFYGYAVVFSVLTDLASLKAKPHIRYPLRMLLYTAGGLAPFFFWFNGNVYAALFVGLIGVASAYTFYALSGTIKGKWPYSGAAAVLLLIILLVLSTSDLTIKKGWKEVRSLHVYEASFTLLHGEVKIPIEAVEGQTVTFEVDWGALGSGGYGMSVLDSKGDYTGMRDIGSGKHSFTAEKSAVYHIVLSGDRLRGSFKVSWEIE